VTPSPTETAANPRARSAKLRSAIRTEAPPRPIDARLVKLAQLPVAAGKRG